MSRTQPRENEERRNENRDGKKINSCREEFYGIFLEQTKGARKFKF